MNFEIKTKENVQVILLKKNLLDSHDSNQFFNEIDALIEQGINLFVLDLSQLTYISSAGLSTFLTLLSKSRIAGGETILACIPPSIQKMLIITKLNSIFSIAETVEEGMEELNAVPVNQ